MSIPPIHQFLDYLHVLGLWISSIPRHMRAAATHVGSAVTPVLRRRSAGSLHLSSLENSVPAAPSPGAVVAIPQGLRRSSEITFSAPPASLTAEPKSMQGSTVSFALSSEKSSGITSTSTVPSPSRVRFVQAVRNVIKMQRATAPFSQLTRSLSPTLLPDGIRGQATQPMPMQGSRVAGLVPKLRGLMPTQVLEAHQALVRHLQFSPNGKFLATSRFVFFQVERRTCGELMMLGDIVGTTLPLYSIQG
jgi:WD repeat-containing protein 26